MVRSKLALTMALLAALTVSAKPQVTPTTAKIVIDGKLDEASWGKAQKYSGFKHLSSKDPQQQKVAADTEFSILADNANIYFGIKCFEPKMDQLKANVSGDSANPWIDDVVEIFLSPTKMPDEYYQFVVSAGNGRWCMYWAEGGNIHPDPYAPLWASAVHKGQDFWSFELKAPISGFYMTKASRWNAEWLVNVARDRKAEREESSWSPLVAGFHEVAKFNKIAGFPIKKPELDIYVKALEAGVESREAQACAGALDAKIEVAPEAAGEYQLRCSGGALERELALPIRLAAGANNVKLDKALFKEQGKTAIRCEVVDKSGKVVVGRDYPVLVEYQPIAFVFDKPGYSRCFFPGQPSDSVSGKVKLRLPEAQAKTARVKLTLKADGVAPQEKILTPKDGVVDFGFDAKGMKYGKAEITANALAGDKIIATATTDIRKLAPAKTALWIENKRLIVNGKPTYALGLYAEGYMGGKWFDEKFKAIRPSLFPAANSMGPKVILEPFRLIPGIEAQEAVRDVKPCDELFAKIRELIEKNRDNDFWFYYISDEPECRGVSPIYLKHIYDFVKEQDPYHPALLGTRAPRLYIDCADVIGSHPYVNPIVGDKGARTMTLPIDKVRDYYDELFLGERSDKVTMAVLQAFSYGYLNVYSDYPTFDEFNCMTWSSILHGAQIQWPYAYHDIGDRPALLLGLRYVNESIVALQDILTAPENKLPVSVKGDDKKLDLRLTEPDGKTMFIAVNLGATPLKVEVCSEHLKKFKELRVFRENHSVPVKDGGIALELAPYQVLILTSEPRDAGLKTLAEFRRELALAEKNRTERGNILFGRGYDIEIGFSSSVFGGVMGVQRKLFDGTPDVLAWRANPSMKSPWLEMRFPKFTPKFSKARIWGNGTQGLEFSIWEKGAWQKVKPAATRNEPYMTELDFGTELSTVKIKLVFKDPADPNNPVELYEVELLASPAPKVEGAKMETR